MTQALTDCTCFNLRKAARAVTQVYDQALRPFGLRITQYSLLEVIGRRGTVSITELAEAAVMDRTTLTRNLRVLLRDGLIRIKVGQDIRVREVTLTPGAKEKLTLARSGWAKAQAHMRDTLGPARVKRLLGDLSAAVGAAGS